MEDTVADSEKVAARFTFSGTHTGTFHGTPPSGKAIVATSIAIYRIVGGKIVEEHGIPDTLSILQQIGAVPSS